MASLTERLYARTTQGKKEDEEERKIKAGIVAAAGYEVAGKKKESSASTEKKETVSKTTTENKSLTERLYARTTQGRSGEAYTPRATIFSSPAYTRGSRESGVRQGFYVPTRDFTSQEEYDSWRGSIRSSDEIKAEMEAIDKALKDNKWSQWGLAYGGNGEAWHEKEKEQAELREKYELLTKELEYSDYFSYSDLAKNADFAQKSVAGESQLGNNLWQRLQDSDIEKAYEYINNIGGYRDNLVAAGEAAGASVTPQFDAYNYMNDEQKATFNYIYHTQGGEAAQKYLDYITDSPLLGEGALNYQHGQEIAEGLNTDFQRAAYGLRAGVDQFSTGMGQLFDKDTAPTSAIQYAGQAAKGELGKVGQFIYDAGAVTGNMLPSILLSTATAGFGAPTAVAGLAGAATLGASAGGNAYNQAMKEGWAPSEAKSYGALVGASEATLQYVLGGIGKLGGTATTKVLTKVSAIDNALARIAATGAVKIGGEVTEELLQEFLEPAIRSIIRDEKYDAPEAKDLIYTALLTALTTGLMEGGSITSAAQNRAVTPGLTENATGFDFNNADEETVKALIEEGLASEENTASHQLALDLQKRQEAGKKISGHKLGTLYQANEEAIAAEEQARREREGTPEEQAASRATGYGKHGSKLFVELVQEQGMDMETAQKAMQVAYEQGLTNSLGYAAKDIKDITQQRAYKAGQQDAILDLAERQKKAPTIRTDAGFDMEGAPSDLIKEDRAFMELMAKAYAVKGTWGESTESESFDGKIDGNGLVTLSRDLGISEAKLREIGGPAHLRKIANIAQERKKSFIGVVAHEINLHRMMELAPEEGLAFVNAMYAHQSKNRPDSIGTLAQAKRESYMGSINISLAMEEISADTIVDMYGGMKNYREAMERILTGNDEKAKSGARTFIELLKDTVARLKRVLARLTGRANVQARDEVRTAIRENERLIQLFEEAQKAALRNVAKAQQKTAQSAKNEAQVKAEAASMKDGVLTRTTDADGTTVLTTANGNPVAQMDENGSALFSLKTYDSFGRAELKRWLDLRVSKNQLDKNDAADIVRQLDEYYEMCQQFKKKYAPFGAWSDASVVTDDKGKPVFSVVKANGEYAMNLDFSLVCKKRRTLDAVFREMIRRGIMNNVDLEEADIAKINDIIRESGFETACALCFVDSKRYRQAKVADTFVTQYNDMVKMLLPEGGDVKIHYFDFVETGHYKNAGTGLHTLSNAQLRDGIEKLKQVMRENGSKTVAYKIAKHLMENPQDRKYVNRGEFMNTDGFENLKVKNPDVLKLYNSSKGSGGPKAALSDVQYLGEILKKNNFTPARAYAVGGVRIQSFSDYIPRLVFDYLQMVADLSAKKLPAHAYTKEAIFVKQFGMTGIKMNMSLVPAVAEDGIAAGLDKDGNYFWFDGQSFGSDVGVKGSGQTGFELAIQIQNTPGYSQHCGTIAVGVSKEHIEKMLDDENIRMIIPYHKSSLNHIVAVMNNIDKYTDYTNVQNTRFKDTGKKIDKKDFNFNEALRRTGDAKTAANEYLAWCEKNGYIPKFDEFAGHENYYKVLEDFSTYDNGEAAPQGAVTMTFPKEGDAFGSMAELIEQGLDEDAVLEGRREKNLSSIVDKVESVLKKREDTRYSRKDGEYAPTFYSHMERTIEATKQDKLGAASVVSMLRGKGVKAEEIKWSGIEQFLEGKKSVTKQELLEFVRGNQLRITEQVLEGRDTHFSMYALEGGSNYREILFRDPKSYYTNRAMDTHWEDAGILAHARVQDFENPFTGWKTLFVEEIQSDWHNAGRQVGYYDEAAISKTEKQMYIVGGQKAEMHRPLLKDLESFYRDYGVDTPREAAESHLDMFHDNPLVGIFNSVYNFPPELRERLDLYFELEKQENELTKKVREIKRGAPDAPFRNNYHEYVMKSLLRMAAEQGYDSIGWTTADIQSERWSSEYAEGYRIEYDQDIPKFMNKYGKKWGAKVEKTELDSATSKPKYYDVNRDEIYDSLKAWKDEVLTNLAFQGLSNADRRKVKFYEFGNYLIAEDPETGLEYDRAEIRRPSNEIWSMDITDAMRESVLYEGQPRYSKKDSEGGISYSQKSDSDLLKENEKLKEVNEALKAQFKLTKFATVDKKSLEAFTKQLLKDYQSGADINETRDALNELYTYIANGEEGHAPSWDAAYRMAYDTAQTILSNSSILNDEMYQMYSDLRNTIRNTGITLNKEDEHDIMGYESLNEFRKANFGRIKLVKNGLSVNSFYQELATSYPEFFDGYEHTHPGDQLSHIAEVLDSLQPIEVNPYKSNMRESATWLANDIMDRFFDLPQAKPTFADKAERKLTEQKIKDGHKLEKLREEKNERIKSIIKAERKKAAERVAKEKADKQNKVKTLKQKQRAKEAKMSENRKARVLRERIMRHVGKLHHKLMQPTDKQHIPQELQGTVLKLLESINLESKFEYAYGNDGMYHRVERGTVLGAEPTKRTQAFAELKKLYAFMENELTIDPDLMGADGLLTDVIAMADKPIAEMSSSELETVLQTIKAIEATISSANKIFADSRWAGIHEAAAALREDNMGKKEKTELKKGLGKLQKLTGLDMETPETFFHMLGESGDGIFRMMRNAQDEHIRLMKEIADFTAKEMDEVKVRKLEGKLHEVTLGGTKIKLSTAQLMELYVLIRRPQAFDHIFMGGILPDVVDSKGFKSISKAKPVRNITLGEVSAALNLLSKEEVAIAEKLQQYASTRLSEMGNDASMKVYGYEKFGEKNYWTIRVNRQETRSDVQQDTAVVTLANRGFTKGVKPHANNSLRLGSIFDTFATHASEMATYAAWLGTLEDVNRIRNYTFRDENKVAYDTVKGIIDTVHGKHGGSYLEKLMADVTNGVKGTHGETKFMSGMVGNFKAASVGANLRVIIQQPTAMLRAADMLGPQYFVTVGNPLNGWKKAVKYAPIAQWKDWGYFDINTGRQMKDVLFDSDTPLDRAKNISMWGAGAMDSLAWGYLWNAVESETRDKKPDLDPKSEEFYKAVAERFTEIVDHTQVVDGILQRSQIMRSADGLTKMATAFMGEPTKQYNMMLQAAYDAKTAKKGERGKAFATLARTAVVLAVSGIANAAAQSIMDAVRDDEDEEYWEKWLAAFKKNLGSTFNPVGYVPYLKDILSILQGYDVSRMDMESIEKVVSAGQNMIKALSGEGKHTVQGAAINLLAEVARLVGLPVSNLKREVTSFAMLAALETDNYLMQYQMEKFWKSMDGNKAVFMDILYKTYINDHEAYKIIYDDMIKNGVSAEDIANGMENRMKTAQGVDSVDKLKQRYLSPTQQTSYDKTMRSVKSSDLWKQANGAQKDHLKEDIYNFTVGNGKGAELEEKMDEAAKYGMSETDYLLWQLALDISDKPDKNGKLGGNPTNEEKANAIEAIGNLSNGEIAFLWNTESGFEAYAAGVDMGAYVDYLGDGNELSLDKLIGAMDYGIDTETYIDFREMLKEVDQPSKNGNLGSYTQDETKAAIAAMPGLTREQKAYLYQSINSGWKNNPWD